MPAKLALGDGASAGDDVEPLVFRARVFENWDGPPGSGRAGCDVPRVWLRVSDRNGREVS